MLYPRVLTPAMEKVIKSRPYRIYRQKIGAVSDHRATQDQKSLFSAQAASSKFSNIHHLSERFALTHAE